jgi:hypothetical protein
MVVLLPPDPAPLDLAEATRRLSRYVRRARESFAAAVALVPAGVVLAATGRDSIGWPLLLGAATAVASGLWIRSERRVLLTRLVAQGDALTLAPVRAHADRLLGRRQFIADGLRHAISSCTFPAADFALVRPERVSAHEERLEWLAAAFADARIPVEPSSAALCVRLLCEPVTSPLYNHQISPDQLDHVLTVIERGFAQQGT